MPRPNPDVRCETCLFYEVMVASRLVGHCVRYPPAFNPDEQAALDAVIVVAPSHWCGEFKQARSQYEGGPGGE
jgi:hypothetical protein